MLMEERNYCVYKHTSPSGKVYIGMTGQSASRRWRNGEGYKDNTYFYRAIKKYGWENITHEILYDNLTKDEACQKEIEMIEFYNSMDSYKGYNTSSGGSCPALGMIHTEEMKKKMSERISGENNPFYGKTHTEEARRKISESRKGIKLTEECKEKVRMNSHRKVVVCVETGEIYHSIHEAERENGIHHGNISSYLRGDQSFAGGYNWRYATEEESIEENIINSRIPYIGMSKEEKRKIYGVKRTVSEDKRENYRKSHKHRLVICIETNKFFEGISSACRETGIDRSSIMRCCKGKNSHAGGFHWRYATEDEIIEYEKTEGVVIVR